MFCPVLSDFFSFCFYFFENALKPPKMIGFLEKKKNLFKNTALLQLEQRFSPNFVLDNKSFFRIWVFTSTGLP